MIVFLFFTMRSCEFSVSTGIRKIKKVTLDCIRFIRKDNLTIPHNDNEIFFAHTLSITFADQKNDKRNAR